MIRVRVIHSLDDFEDDLRNIAARAPKDIMGVVREGVKVGNSVAKDFAKASSRKHARLYPGTFTTRVSPAYHSSSGVSIFSGEYGPEGRGQGLLASILENGSRNNKPHYNLARSADLIGPAFAQEVRGLADEWFW